MLGRSLMRSALNVSAESAPAMPPMAVEPRKMPTKMRSAKAAAAAPPSWAVRPGADSIQVASMAETNSERGLCMGGLVWAFAARGCRDEGQTLLRNGA